MKIIKSKNWYKKAQTNQFGMEEPKRANDIDIERQKSLEFKSMPYNKDFVIIPAKTKHQLNNQIYNVTQGYYDKIPLNEIFTILKNQNIIPLQEDGTEWSGFLVGGAECGSNEAKNQIVNFLLAQKIGEELILIKNANLLLTWCKMGTGKYEVISYVS